jgi:Flagellar basal body rod FlgEFG protein C-terminal
VFLLVLVVLVVRGISKLLILRPIWRYVSYPDINPLTEMVDLMGATRAYGLNSSAVQAEKGMVSASIEILK